MTDAERLAEARQDAATWQQAAEQAGHRAMTLRTQLDQGRRDREQMRSILTGDGVEWVSTATLDKLQQQIADLTAERDVLYEQVRAVAADRAEAREERQEAVAKVLELASQLAAMTQERDAWTDTAAQAYRNTDYYRGLVTQIGEMLGREAYTQDDGGICDQPLCAKVPDVVRQRLADLTAARDALLEQLHAMAAAQQGLAAMQRLQETRDTLALLGDPAKGVTTPAFPASALRSGPWTPVV